MNIIDDKKKSVIIGIRLGKKDEDLKSWFLAIKKRNLEQSFYIKKVLESYIKKEPIQLGKVHYVKHDEPYKTSYTVSTQDTNILSLIDTLESNNIKVSSFLKNIMRKSISIIPLSEEEYIPNYYNMYDIENMFLHEQNSQPTKVEKQEINQNENKIDNHSIKTETTEVNIKDSEISVTSTTEKKSPDAIISETKQNESKEKDTNKKDNSQVPFAMKFVKMGK